MKNKFTCAIEYTVYSSQFFKVILHTFQYNHSLPILVLHHCIFFKCFCKHLHFRKCTNSANPFILRIKDFSFTNCYFQLRVKSRKKASDHILKTIKNGKSANQSKCSKGYPTYGNTGYDINSVMLFF